MVTIKEYAAKKNVSYEAVRKQVNRYRVELGEHLYKHGRTQYLDEEGEAFLDNKRLSNPVVLVEKNKDEQLDELQRENDSLRIKIMELQEQLLSSKDLLLDMTGKVAMADYSKRLLEQKEADVRSLQQQQEESERKLIEKEDELKKAQEELESYRPTVFGLFKKVK